MVENIDTSQYDLDNSVFLSSFTFTSQSVIYRGVHYKTNMHLCVKKDDFDNYELLKIKYIFIDSNYTKLGFMGNIKKISYICMTGIYERISNYTANEHYVEYKNLLTYEPVLNKLNYFLFKHVPLYNDK